MLPYDETYENTEVILVGWEDSEEREKEYKSTEGEFCRSSAFLVRAGSTAQVFPLIIL